MDNAIARLLCNEFDAARHDEATVTARSYSKDTNAYRGFHFAGRPQPRLPNPLKLLPFPRHALRSIHEPREDDVARDRLPSWNDGAAKRAIVDFVTESTTKGSARFVPEAERIAAFDNDGTLWVEQPIPAQGPFLFAQLLEQVNANPNLAARQPYKAIINHDSDLMRAIARQDPVAVQSLVEAVGNAFAGTTAEVFDNSVRDYLKTHQHERYEKPYTDLIYQPMVELFDLLRAHHFRIFICSGGGRDFMRVFAEETWGLFKENVIGSAPVVEYRDGRLVRTAKVYGRLSIGPGKPEDIYARTGRVARFVGGNGDDDKEMLELADFPLVIVHDDDEREYAYTVGAESLLPAAAQGGWTMVSMRDDWNTLFKA